MFDTSEDIEVPDQRGLLSLQPRRWRFMMYYMDHTVLSFELSKRRMGESPSLGDMVV